MDTLKNAAIILLGMGEDCAGEVLKNLSQKEVETIINIMDTLDNVSEYDIIKALNAFFQDTQQSAGLHLASNTYIKNTLVHAMGAEKANSIIDSPKNTADLAGFDLMNWQPDYLIFDALEDEHPQIITITLLCMDNEKAAALLQKLPETLRKNVVKRMTNLSPVSHNAMKQLSLYLEEQFTVTEKYQQITNDGINMAANIIAHLDGDTENEIMNYFTKEDKSIFEKLQDKLFPFEKLAEMDNKSLQTLLAEIDQDELVKALKGIDDNIKAVFFKNMSAKNVELLKDDMDSIGPVKIVDIIKAQKKIITQAKKMGDKGDIFLPNAKASAIM